MSRILKALAIASAIAIVSAAGLIFVLLENPDQFKSELSQAVTANTGYNLEIKGELTWRYWPPIAIRAQEVSLLARTQPHWHSLIR